MICRQCKQEKSNFPIPRKKTKPSAWHQTCKDCHKANQKVREKIFRAVIRDAKNKPCADCKKRFPTPSMDFDHLPGNTKNFDLGQCCSHTMEDVMLEIEKCEVVCANCHRIRTYNRQFPDAPILNEDIVRSA